MEDIPMIILVICKAKNRHVFINMFYEGHAVIIGCSFCYFFG